MVIIKDYVVLGSTKQKFQFCLNNIVPKTHYKMYLAIKLCFIFAFS